MGHGAQSGIIVAIVIAIVAIIILSFWIFYGRKTRRKKISNREIEVLPLQATHRSHSNYNRPTTEHMPVTGGDAPPPRYDQMVPPQHQRLAGGMSPFGEEEAGIVANGKTPLSEISFENVVFVHTHPKAH